MLVPDLVKHLVFARELQLGWGFRFGHVGRELNGATRYSKSLVQEALIGKRRKKAGGPARKAQPRLGWFNLPVQVSIQDDEMTDFWVVRFWLAKFLAVQSF